MIAWLLSDDTWQKKVFSSCAASLEAWQWMFSILPGFFPLQLLHSLSVNWHCFYRGFLSTLDTSVWEFSIISSVIFPTSPASPSASSLLRGLYMQLHFSAVWRLTSLWVFVSYNPKKYPSFRPRPHILHHVMWLFVYVTINSLEMPLHASVKNFFCHMKYFEVCLF